MPAHDNLPSVVSHPAVVQEYLEKECSLGRMVGPLPIGSTPGLQISPFGVIPKGHTPGKWRLIVDLSHPEGRSVNDGISKGYSDGKDRYLQCLQGDSGAPGGSFVVGYVMGCLGIHRLCAPIWAEVSTQKF